MEGERLLQCVKNGSDGGSLLRELEVYLAPLLHSKASPSQQVAAKYGMYSMKMLRACVQQLTGLKKGHAGVATLVGIAGKSYECIRRVQEHTPIVSLSLEKLLFHMVVQSMAKGLVADAMVFAGSLHEQLSLSRPDFLGKDGGAVDNEYDTVCKQAFNQLWKACVDLEQSGRGKAGHSHALLLDVRRQALAFLTLTAYEVAWVFERTLRAVSEFDQASSNSVEEHQRVCNFLRTVLDTLLDDIGGGKPKSSPQSIIDTSECFSSLVELNLHFAKRCKHLQKPSDALSHCQKLQRLIGHECHTGSWKLYSAAVSITTATLLMSEASPPQGVSKNSKRSTKANPQGDLSETIRKHIQAAVDGTSRALEAGEPNTGAIQCLVEALEFFKKRLESAANHQDRTLADVLPDALVSSVDAPLHLLLDLLRHQRALLVGGEAEAGASANRAKQQRLSLQKVINRQLSALHLVATVLLHRMGSAGEEVGRCDGKEVGKMPEAALRVCRRTQSLIEEVSGGAGGSVSTNEHRWLGTNAYNLGLICYRRKWYPEAAPLLAMACQQLEKWCLTSESQDEDKIAKVQLLSKYELLVDCQRKGGQHSQAMATAAAYLWSHTGCLAGQLTTPVEWWVKAKREAVKSSSDERLRTRTLFDAIQENVGTVPDESSSLVSKLLEQELSVYKIQRHDTTVEQYAVLCDLLSLYVADEMRLHRAHTHIEQAQLLREGTLETDCCPVDCCREAIRLLEDLAQDFMQQQQQQHDKASSSSGSKDYLVVFDLLATAHFWLYICESESNQATYIPSQFDAAKEDSLPSSSALPDRAATSKKNPAAGGDPGHQTATPAYTLAAEYSAMQPLDRALDIWRDLMEEGCHQSMFNDPASTCYCLRVAASLCELADRPMRQLQALNLLALLSSATPSSGEDTALACCRMARTLCGLGAAHEARALLDHARAVLGRAGQGGEGPGSVEAAVAMTECYVLLAANQIPEFESLLASLLQSQGPRRRSRQTYLRSATLKHLQSLHLALGPSRRSVATVAGANMPDSNPDPAPSALDLRAEAMRLQMGVGRLVFGEEVFGNDPGLQADGFKLVTAGSDSGWNDIEFNQWTVMASVLQSLLDVGSLFLEQGCVREAKSYLKEGLLLAEKFMLPRRCAAFLLQLANLQAQCGQAEDCQASLAKVQQTLRLPQTRTASRHSEMSTKAPGIEEAEDDDDDDFIRTKRMSVSAECFPGTLGPGPDTSPSPVCGKPVRLQLPGYHSHPLACRCPACSDVSLHRLDLALFLRRAQGLELRGEAAEALGSLGAGLDVGDQSTARMPSLLLSNCSLLESAAAVVVQTTKRGKRGQKEVASSPPSRRCQFHFENLLEIRVCEARLHLLSGSLHESEAAVRSGLELAAGAHSAVLESWLRFYDVLVSLERKAGVGEEETTTTTTTGDLIASTWEVKSSGPHPNQKQLMPPMSQGLDLDLASQFDKLDLGQPGRGQTHFRSALLSERMQRPEVSRKLSEKVSELGIFCDMSDNEEDADGVHADPPGSATSVRAAALLAETPQTVASSSRKGNLVFSVRKKKKPSKVALPEEVTPIVRAAPSTSAFDFDEPSPVKTKKAVRGKKLPKTGRRNAKMADVESSEADPVFEVVDLPKATRGSSSRAKRSAKNAPSPCEESEPQQGITASLLSLHKSKPAARTKEEVNAAKPRRGRRPQTTEAAQLPNSVPEPEPEPKPAPARPRRGRRPNPENLRSEVTTEAASDAGLLDLLSTSLEELDSPPRAPQSSPPPPPASPNLIRRHDFDETSCRSSPSPAFCGIDAMQSARPSLILAELDEIEIPRAGRNSDSDLDSSKPSSAAPRRRTGRRPATTRKKMAKKAPTEGEEEEAEVLRASRSSSSVDKAQTRTKTSRNPLLTTIVSDQGQGSRSLMTAADLDSLIAQLEGIATEVGQRAPAALYRSVCQLLAACLGDRHPADAALYLSKSTAVTLRHQKLASLAKKIKKLKKTMDSESGQSDSFTSGIPADSNGKEGPERGADLRHLTDERALFSFNGTADVVQETLGALPEGWTVCMLSVVPSGLSLTGGLVDGDRLLICRLSQGQRPVIVNHNMHSAGHSWSPSGLLAEFDSILSESKLSVRETDKRAWWTCRQQLDQRMQALTEGMEEAFLGPWKGIVRGVRTDPQERKSVTSDTEKLQSLLEAACKKPVDTQLCQCIVESASQLSRLQLNSALTSLTGLPSGSDQLLSLVSSVRQLAKDWAPAARREPVILILDKQIQQLPWENTSSLKDSQVCRMPSLYFILSHLRARLSCSSSSPSSPSRQFAPSLDPTDAFFVLNPSNDLANTQKTFQKWFEKENGWKGVVARPPTKEEYKSALVHHQLFVFCGHGNGREFLTGDDIQRLTCRATSLLIGCSSGRLNVTGIQEASGMVLNYLVAECPCLVANLWDVTDRDIDRFLEQLLRSWLAGSNGSGPAEGVGLLDCMAEARQACKLQYLIGCSPVVYGLPVRMRVKPV